MVGDSLPQGWKWATVEQLKKPDSKAIVSGPFGSNIGSRFFVASGIPVIRGNNLTTDTRRFVDDGFVFITDEKAKELKNCEAVPNDLIFTAAGTLGQVGIIPSDSKHSRYIISNKQMRARLDENLVLPLFAFYCLSSAEMVEYIQQRNTGSTVPLINLSVLRQLPIPLPPLPEQKAIARILGALDDKIELNRHINYKLEEMAQALFKSWFVDFDPVVAKAEGRVPFGMNAETASLFPVEFEETRLGSIPKGWSVDKVSAICSTQYGYTTSSSDQPIGPKFLRITDINKEPWIEWENVPFCEVKEGNKAKYELRIGDILVSRMADPGKAGIVEHDIDAVFASYLVRLKAKNLAWAYFLFYFLRSDFYLDYADGVMSGSVQLVVCQT